ncbi:hypothetical protein [Streptomyces osmaniensis]|uniref:hypothetical protein n=1 Tax=Streptomyces osmaniensis TaxID=593134 RepID=UPI001C3251D2|nr:hypothetical protein KJK32_00495 [Streptomyces sp. JCM17656]
MSISGERKVWVGDQVHDGIADREGIITDAKGGMYVLRPVFTWAGTWTAPDDKEMTLTLSREQRPRRRREEG